MSAPSAARRGRRFAEAQMLDTCAIKRVVGVEPDPLTGKDIVTYETLYEGRCKLNESLWQMAATQSVAATVLVQQQRVDIPSDAPRMRTGDVVFMADDTATPSARGVIFRIEGMAIGSHTTAQRLPVSVMAGDA